MKELETNKHSVFSLNYHLVLVVKYRRKAIDDKRSCLITTGGAPLEVIRKYIESQGEENG